MIINNNDITMIIIRKRSVLESFVDKDNSVLSLSVGMELVICQNSKRFWRGCFYCGYFLFCFFKFYSHFFFRIFLILIFEESFSFCLTNK